MMFLLSFMLLSILKGVLCDPFKCMLKERKNCDESLIPRDFPNTPEELRTICSNIDTFGTCMVNVQENCGYDSEVVNRMRKGIRFVNIVCAEHSPIFKVISSNLGCITPVARTLDAKCNQSMYSEENFEAMMKHEKEITDNYERLEILRCLSPLWEVYCPSFVLGLHCGSEVKDAVEEILKGTNYRYTTSCTREALDELYPILVTYESIIEAEMNLENAIEKRK